MRARRTAVRATRERVMTVRPFRHTTLAAAVVAAALVAALAVPSAAADPSPAPVPAPAATAPTHTVTFGAQSVETPPVRWQVTTAGAATTTTLGLAVLSGDTTFDGIPITATITGALYYIDGTGPFTGALVFDSGAGDLLAMRYDAQVALGPSGTVIDGVLTVLGGSGRWAGVTGYGVVNGARTGAVGSPVQYDVSLWLAGMPAAG